MSMRITILLFALAGVLGAQSEPCLSDAILDVSDAPGAGPEYPRPRVEATCEGDDLVVRSNGIPHYEFVQVTPNPLMEQQNEYRVPASPRKLDAPIPIGLLGSIGFAVNGIAIFGPNEGPVPVEEQFGDPIFNAIMDACMGHTANEYHYHAMVEKCLSDGVKEGEESPILGFAFDGFPIRGPWGCTDAECSEVVRHRSSWEKVREPHQDSWDAYAYVVKDGPEYLDACNGHSHGDGDYHYHVTETWPYILGCFAGEPTGGSRRVRGRPQVSQGPPRARPPGGGPPGGGRGPGAQGPRAGQGPGAGGPRGGRRPGQARPNPQEVRAAAEALGADEGTVAKALRVEPGSVKPTNLAASARSLGVEQGELIEALGRTEPPPRQRPNQAPPGEPECFFRCGQSEEDAVGCTLTGEHKVLCYRPCDDNKCG